MQDRIARRGFLEISSLLAMALMADEALAHPGFPSGKLADIMPGMVAQHPRLLMNGAKLAECRAKAKEDAVYARLIARIIGEADLVLTEPVVRYNLTGAERPSMLGGSRDIIRKIAHCAFAWRWTGDQRYADRAKREMLNAAHYPEWNHTHFLDLAETAMGVALGFDWLHATLNEDERATIRMALVEKCLLWADRAYRGSDDEWLAFPHYWWNWNPVCNVGVLAAAIAVAEDEPQLVRDIIAGVRRSLPKALDALEPDGCGAEGPVYWSYGIAFHVLGAAMFESALGSTQGMADTHGFGLTDLYRLWVEGTSGACFNYGDCKEHLAANPALGWLGARNHHPLVTAVARREMMQALDQPVHKGEFDRFFFFYALAYPEAGAPPPDPSRAHHFRGEADIACFRGDWTTPGVAYVGFKAGDNGANHSHMDLGSFVVDGQGLRWGSDLGSDSYQVPGYFDNSGARFRVFRVSTASHSTIMPEGVNQDPKAVARITSFAEAQDGGHAIADLSAAYPGHAQSVKRGLRFSGNGRAVHIRDEIVGAKPGARWRWGMVTPAQITLEGARAVLTREGKHMMVVAHHPDARFEVVSLTPPTPVENPNTGYSMLVLFLPAGADGSALCEVTLYPLGGEGPAPRRLPLARW